jgi:plasmid stability protein
MASITIRNLDDRVKETIRLKAAKSGHSMEEEARRLLTWAADAPTADEVGLGTAIRRRFASAGRLGLARLPRGRMRAVSNFE